jgi:hypothetical protein
LAIRTLTKHGVPLLLFFGFQEIQAMEHEIQRTSKIPILSWIEKGKVYDKAKSINIAMICTVITASLINIFYALAVYASQPNVTSLESSQIPALFLAQSKLGLGAEASTVARFHDSYVHYICPAIHGGFETHIEPR